LVRIWVRHLGGGCRPGVEIVTVERRAADFVLLVLEPHPPAAVRQSVDTGVDAARHYDAHELPIEQVSARVVDDVTCTGPRFRHAANVGNEGVILPAKVDDFRRPERVAARLKFQPTGGAAVLPRRAVVGRRGNPDVRAVDPLYALLVVGISTAVGVQHPPALLVAVPDRRGIGSAVMHRVAVQRCRCLT